MERFGIFVDAGYLYAASGSLLFGLTDRRKLVLDFRRITDALTELAANDCRREHLRTYWYDGARDLVPSPEQLQVANLPGTKLRLGRLTREGQKGVDSRIVRDLIILSTERAMSDVYLLGGDEDLREGVSEAQERGVRVVLIGIKPLDEQNLSPTLAMEADDVLILDRAFIEPHFRLREPEFIPAIESDNPADPAALGRAFAVSYVEGEGEGMLAELLGGQPRIPPEVDRQLLSYACRSLGVTRVDDDFRTALRRGFWAALKRSGD